MDYCYSSRHIQNFSGKKLELIERYKKKNFYDFLITFRVPVFKSYFEMNYEELNDFLEKVKREVFKGVKELVYDDIYLTAFNKNPFKSCKYYDIGKFLF